MQSLTFIKYLIHGSSKYLFHRIFLLEYLQFFHTKDILTLFFSHICACNNLLGRQNLAGKLLYI